MSDKDAMPDNLPEEIWVFKGAKKGTIIVDTIPDDNTAYRLKSTVDAERAEDGKTIRELAKALERFVSIGDLPVKKEVWRQADKTARKALADNAPRIAEAQEGEG